MAIGRNAKGTASAKASGDFLESEAEFKVKEGNGLTTAIAFDNSQGPPTVVKFGRREMERRLLKANADSGMTLAVYTAPGIRHATLRKVRAEWSANIAARVMINVANLECGKVDVQQSRQLDATAAPATGTAVTTTVADTLHLAFFASKGPVNDVAGTAGLGHTLGQRVGTAGVPPVSNITLQETYEILSATGDCRATLSGATERDWASGIIAFKAVNEYEITHCYHRRWICGPTHDRIMVRYKVVGESNPYQTYIEYDDYINATADERDAKILKACAWHAQHIAEDEMPADLGPDAGLLTELAAFVGRKFKV